MDYNFLQSVFLAESNYCWIIGNDDIPTEMGLPEVIRILEETTFKSIDLIVTPFQCYDYESNYINTVYPLGIEIEQIRIFDTQNAYELSELINLVHHNSALFGFLSNVIFRRKIWIKYEEMFKNKMDTIFIQMYMNIQALKEGAYYLYLPQKIIKNYLDDNTNQTIHRKYDIVKGLYGVVTYFFEGVEREKLQKIIVDEYISGDFFELSIENPMRKNILNIKSAKIDIYQKYFVYIDERMNFFNRKNVIIYGAGKYGRKALAKLQEIDVNILGFSDIDKNKQGTYVDKYIIFDFDKLLKYYELLECVVVVANNKSLVDIIYKLEKFNIKNIALIT